MSEELFADGILGIGYGKGAVRIDFFALSAEAVDAKGQPAKERRQRIVMTTEGFVEAFTMLSGVMDKLLAQGVVRRQTAAASDAPGQDAPKDDLDSPSPNF
ncbi:MAG: hypothetical protein ACLGQH_06535 [Acidobacteriota bacterium]